MKAKLRKAASILLLFWLGVISQACISEVKPVLKQGPPDIPARIAEQQKQITIGASANDFTPESAQRLQKNLDRIKEKHSSLQASQKLTEKETEALIRMLNQNSDAIAASRQPLKAK